MKHESYITNCHPKRTEVEHKINWSKSRSVAYGNDFRTKRATEPYFINTAQCLTYVRSRTFFPM